MDIQIKKSLFSLRSRHIKGIFAKSSEDASRKILNLIPRDTVVGIGDSTTIRQLGIAQALKVRGTRVLDPFEPKETLLETKDAQKIVRVNPFFS
jgi:hypothetical protein